MTTQGDGSEGQNGSKGVTQTGRPSVFLSYAHESAEHKKKVYGLAASLRRDGFRILIDIEKDTDEDWPLWMQRQLQTADFVLCVCTAEYLSRFDHGVLPNVGLGVGWEGGLIRRMLYEVKLSNTKIFPVYFSESGGKCVPITISGDDRFLLQSPDGYESLLRKLKGIPRFKLSPEDAEFPATPLLTETIKPLFDRPGHLDDETVTEPESSGRISHSPIGTIELRIAEILAGIEQLETLVFEALCVELNYSAADKSSLRMKFADWLVRTCSPDDAIDAFVTVVRTANSNETCQVLRNIADRLIPIKFSTHFSGKIAPILTSTQAVFVEGIAGHASIAECIAASYDCCPLRLDSTNVGETAVQTVNLPNNGGGPEAVLKGSIEFLQSIFGEVGNKFYGGSNPAPRENQLEALCVSLVEYGQLLKRREKRTVYLLISFPEEKAKRDFLQQVINRIVSEINKIIDDIKRTEGKNVSGLMFVEVTQQVSKDDRLYLHCIFSSRFN